MRSETTGVLPFEYDFDASKLTTIKHTSSTTDNAGSTTKTQVTIPELDVGASKMQVIYFVQRFNHARRIMAWTNGPVLFAKFPIHLVSTQDQEWWTTNSLLTNQTVAGFNDLVKNFIAFKLDNVDAYDQHLDFLEGIKKPINLSVAQFEALLSFHNTILPLLPGAPEDIADARLNDRRYKKILFKAMPKQWQANFENADKEWSTATITEIVNYMSRQAKRDPPKSNKNGNNNSANTNTSPQRNGYTKNGNHNNNNNNNKNSNGQSPRTGNRNGLPNNNQANNNNTRNGNRNNTQRIQSSDVCPLPGHQGHTWGNCYQNASNPNRNNRSTNNNGSTRSSNSNNQRNSGGDAHVTEGTFNNNLQQPPDDVHFLEIKSGAEAFFTDDLEPEYSDLREIPETPAQVTLPTAENTDLVPTSSTLATCKSINNKPGNYLLKSLFDSGATECMCNKQVLPRNIEIHTTTQQSMITTQGAFQCNEYVFLKDIGFPEISLSRKIKQVKCFLFDSKAVRYDVILGRKFMKQVGIDLSFTSSTLTWCGDTIPFHPIDYFSNKEAIRAVLTVDSYRADCMLAQSPTMTYVDSNTKPRIFRLC